MSQLLTLIGKDLHCELRSKETLGLHLTLALLFAALASFGVFSALLSPREISSIFPLLIWLIFLFCATSSISRSFEYEMSQHAIEGLLLSAVPAWVIFLSKVLVNTTIGFIGHMLAATALVLFFNLSVSEIILPFLLLSLAVILAYSSLATLLAFVSMHSRMRGMLLPLILLPLMFPLLFAAVELTAELLQSGRIDLSSGWVSLLLVFDGIYLVLGLNLFEHVVTE